MIKERAPQAKYGLITLVRISGWLANGASLYEPAKKKKEKTKPYQNHNTDAYDNAKDASEEL